MIFTLQVVGTDTIGGVNVVVYEVPVIVVPFGEKLPPQDAFQVTVYVPAGLNEMDNGVGWPEVTTEGTAEISTATDLSLATKNPKLKKARSAAMLGGKKALLCEWPASYMT